MFTIGTSGHIDHGKTLLIKALTGIDTDRLPEEKKRGMTIDLGFAYFPGPGGEPVGVIDVPGHERFIRNMVAGAWSLDLALLVVAADDGWMQQSGDHLLVLHYLGITDIILVISKRDIASPARIREVENDSLDKIKSITGIDVPSVSVSAKTGENIDKLKELILSELSKIKTSGESFPFLYVDRVFNIKGSGTIITGSLKGKSIDKETKLISLPEEKPVRIRSLQSYNSSVDKAVPVSRLAINIANLKKDEIHRGACLTTEGSDFLAVSEFIFRLKKDRIKPNIRNHSEVEIALGTADQLGEIHFLKDSRIGRIILKQPVAARWNQPFLLIRHGGSSIIGGGF
ncbi:MAG: selenocysteine-specific translation elongation factor, partial [Spirochaeta sp.]|nr:selenocysteine-specific translation elongation factor [Spirochaeta sp.]